MTSFSSNSDLKLPVVSSSTKSGKVVEFPAYDNENEEEIALRTDTPCFVKRRSSVP